MKKLIGMAIALLLATTAYAQQSVGGLQYTYLQAQWNDVDFDDIDIDLDGPAAAASFKINDSFYVTADHMRASDQGVRMERIAVAGGFRVKMSRVLDINMGAGLVDYDLKGINYEDDSGLLMYVRARGMIEPNWEISAGFQYEDAVVSDTAFTFSAGYHFHKQVSAGLAVQNGDLDVTSLYLRLAF